MTSTTAGLRRTCILRLVTTTAVITMLPLIATGPPASADDGKHPRGPQGLPTYRQSSPPVARPASPRGPQGLPTYRQSSPPVARPASSRGPQGLPGRQQSSVAKVADRALRSPHGGVSTALIVLLSLGGIVVVTALAYSAMRVVHHRGALIDD